MIRMIGAALVLGGAGGVGIGKGLQFYRQLRQLRDFVAAVEILKCELNYSLMPLPKLYRVAGRRTQGACSRFFHNLATRLEQGTPRSRAVEHALADTGGLCLPKDAMMSLLELCSALGRYDMDGENRMLQLSGQRLKTALERTEREKRPLAKSYASLGLCTGVALVILML